MLLIVVEDEDEEGLVDGSWCVVISFVVVGLKQLLPLLLLLREEYSLREVTVGLVSCLKERRPSRWSERERVDRENRDGDEREDERLLVSSWLFI